jgi:SAM-dependent methyltransferase
MPQGAITRPILTRGEAREHYDRSGRHHDRRSRFAVIPLVRLCELGEFGAAEAVVEFGCGTGRLAHDLMTNYLPKRATYIGFDVSETMVELTRRRLVPYGARASVVLTDGRPRIPLPQKSCDRFVSTYVLDLLSSQDILRTLDQAWQVLRPDGLLCLAGLTYGTTLLSRWVAATWLAIHSLRPTLVGGCRPISFADYLGPASWKILHSTTVVSLGVPTEVLIARPRAHAQPGTGADRVLESK